MKRVFPSSILLLVLCGCPKTVEKDVAPQLELKVMDAQSQVINEANVKLFGSLQDWAAKTNLVQEQKTNPQGIARFQKLQTQQYYFFAQKDSLNNLTGIATHTQALKQNQITTLTIILK